MARPLRYGMLWLSGDFECYSWLRDFRTVKAEVKSSRQPIPHLAVSKRFFYYFFKEEGLTIKNKHKERFLSFTFTA